MQPRSALIINMQNTFILFIIINHIAEKCSRQFQEGFASTNGKKTGELSAFTTEVPCMYASREDKESKQKTDYEKNQKTLGDSCRENPVKAVVSLNQLKIKY